MLERSLHFPIKPGVVAAWNTRTVSLLLCSTAHPLAFAMWRQVTDSMFLLRSCTVSRRSDSLKTTKPGGARFGTRRNRNGSRHAVVSESSGNSS